MSKTLTERLVAARELVAKLESAIKSNTIINNVADGDEVTIRFGRAEKVRTISGKVVGLKTDEDGGKTVVVLDGTDFKTYTVPASKIIDNPSATNRDPGSEVADTVDEADLAEPDAIEQFVNGGEAGEDPLLNA